MDKLKKKDQEILRLTARNLELRKENKQLKTKIEQMYLARGIVMAGNFNHFLVRKKLNESEGESTKSR